MWGVSAQCVVEEGWSWAGKMVEPLAEARKEEEEDRLLQPLKYPTELFVPSSDA